LYISPQEFKDLKVFSHMRIILRHSEAPSIDGTLFIFGEKAVHRVADADLLAHDFYFGSGAAAKASLTIVWASSRMRLR
jgi:hypothetical protein